MNSEKALMDILAMSGYAGYVWSAFGVTLFALIILYLSTRQRLNKALKTQQQLRSERGTR